MIAEPMIYDFLHRNGIVIERARREHRSLSKIERTIIMMGRQKAWEKKIDMFKINEIEMIGERDYDQVLAPIKVVAIFAYYSDPFENIPAEACYLIAESNHPGLPAEGNVGPDQLQQAGIKLPKTPSYQDWVKGGRKCYRGKKS